VSYRRKIKNRDNHRKDSDNIKAGFADGFQHDPPPWWAGMSIELGLYFGKQLWPPLPELLRKP